MAVVFGYGGIANTNGARDFSGKAAAASETRYSKAIGLGGYSATGDRRLIIRNLRPTRNYRYRWALAWKVLMGLLNRAYR